jgi:ribosomal protein L11 methyltransferase
VHGIIEIPPCWRIGPLGRADSGISIVIEPETGFGDGAHETTQLCLQAIAALAPRGRPVWRMLDFGSGSGILSIAAAKLGASVDAVEIDDRAIGGLLHNARLNGVADRIVLARTLQSAGEPYELVVANILCAVLVAEAGELVRQLARGAALVLSGLVSTDVPVVSARYAPLFGGLRPEVYELGDWRALVWRASP